MDRAIRAAVTLDVHDVDEPEDIRFAARTLSNFGVRATFFIPSALLSSPAHRGALAALPRFGHEVGSHSHAHDRAEFRALQCGEAKRLDFLERSRDLHVRFFGTPPVSFRAPFWGRVSPRAARLLVELGYRVDSSATPQRLPWLGSSPFDRGWMFAPRAPYALVPGLLELPTSCFVIPAATQAFQVLRARGSNAFMELLRLEAKVARDRVLVTMFHVEDFHACSRRRRGPARIHWFDFLPLPTGGLGLRHCLRERDPRRIAETSEAMLRWFARFDCGTTAEIAAEREGATPALSAAHA